MNKFIILVFSSIFLSSSFAVEYDKNEPRYFLALKLFQSSAPPVGAKIDLYEKPVKDSKVITIKNEASFERNEYMKRFYDQKEPFEFILIASTEKVDSFFKVFYKNKYLWVNNEDAIHVYGVNDYFKSLGGFTVKGEDYRWSYHKIEGENKKFSEIIPLESLYFKEEIEKVDLENSGPSGIVKEVRIVKNRVWIKVDYCSTFVYANLDCKGDFTFWFRPYDNNGRITNWVYAGKETSLQF